MPNMSYCKFRNTLGDLEDCVNDLQERGGNVDGYDEYEEQLSEEEFVAAKNIIEMCREVTEDFDGIDLNELKLDSPEV